MRDLWISLLICWCCHQARGSNAEDVKVVIIGAGASGYAAGCRLLEHNFTDFVILEAQDRIGGRVHSVPFGNGTIDMGGEWIHGLTNNVVYDMVKKFDLAYNSTTMMIAPTFQSDGKRFGPEIFEAISEFVFAVAAEVNAIVTESRGQYFTRRYWDFIHPFLDNKIVTRSEAESLLNLTEAIDNSLEAADSWFDGSPHAFINGSGVTENAAWKLGGYSTVFQLLSKKIPNPNEQLKIDERIRLRKEVTKVDWSGDRAIVRCADGSEFTADRVLTTVSLNVLKATADKIFSPPLPQQNLNAITGLGMGTVGKIFLEFPYRWWETSTGGFALSWRKEEVEKLPEDAKWTSGLSAFNVHDNFPLTLLCGWLTGKRAETMEALPEQVVKEQVMSVLRQFAGPGVPEAVSIRRSQWYSNPFTRGSYSHRTVTSDAMNIWHKDLAQSVSNAAGKVVLQFAGEATNDPECGTVHGAIETGFREADEILENVGRK